MAVTNSGMTLYTDNDTQQSWTGSNGLDIEVFKQGTGSESWLIGKNATETATLTLSAAMGTPKYFTFYMKSDWGAFYTSITASLSDGTSVNLFTVATGGKNATPNLTPEISGDFKPSVMQIDQGSTPAYVPNNHTIMEVVVDASSSGNIRAITNHWIDCMYYGNGRSIGGTTAGDLLFKESAQLDVSSDTFDGLSSVVSGITFFQSDVTVTTTSGNSFGETVVFASALNTDNIYTLTITGTADFQASSYAAETGATLNLDTSTATSWQMLGGSLVGLGTTAGDLLFKESAQLDVSSDTFDGLSSVVSGITFFQSDVTVTTTSGNSFGETVVFASALNTDNIYTLTITGTADFQASSYAAETGATLNLDTSTATSWQMLGGSLVGLGTTAFKASQVVSGAVFTDRTSITHNASLFTGNTVNTSGIMTVSATGTCTGNLFSNGTGTSSLLLADLAHAPSNTFVSDGSSHAVELTSIGGGSMVWSGDTTSYDAGATGSPVTATATGNEDIYVNVASGTLTINVADGATTPSIRSAGAVVNVVAGQKTMTFTVSPSITGYEYAIYTVTAKGSLAGRVEVQHVEVHNSATFAYSYTYSAGVFLAVQLLFGDGSVNDYTESVSYYDLAASDQSISINLNADINN